MNNVDDFRAAIEGIGQEIQVSIQNKCPRAAILLTYSTIDAMAFLGMPASQDDVKGVDFIDWADRYIHFDGAERLSGLELYSARCGMLHTLSIQSKLTRNGKTRQLFYRLGDPNLPDVDLDPENPFGTVSIEGLAFAVFSGIDDFLNDLAADPNRLAVARQRLSGMLTEESRYFRM